MGEETPRLVSSVETDDHYDFPWWQHGYAWKMGPNGMFSPDYVKEMEREYSFENFREIKVEGNIKLNVLRSDHFEIHIREGEEYEEQVTIEQSGSLLSISTGADQGEPMVVEVNMPELAAIEAVNTGDIQIRDFNQEKMLIRNTGEGQIKAVVNVNQLDVELTGDGNMDLRGEGRRLKAILKNEARLDAERFNVKTADVEAVNESWVKVSAADTLRQRVDDGSELISKGNPAIVNL
jgi:hypothetical protein